MLSTRKKGGWWCKGPGQWSLGPPKVSLVHLVPFSYGLTETHRGATQLSPCPNPPKNVSGALYGDVWKCRVAVEVLAKRQALTCKGQEKKEDSSRMAGKPQSAMPVNVYLRVHVGVGVAGMFEG